MPQSVAETDTSCYGINGSNASLKGYTMYIIRNKQTGNVMIRRINGKMIEAYKTEEEAKENLLALHRDDKDGWIAPSDYIITDDKWMHPRDRW